MNNFYIREISPENAKKVIKNIGFDESYIKIGLKKYKFKLCKICNLSCPQATIIKQLALSVGADAALHREVITCKIEKTDLLIGSTISQLEIICQKLKTQPFKLQKVSEELLSILNKEPPPVTIRKKEFNWAKKTYIMGILNVTPDSFSDGGKYLNPQKALDHAKEMIESGADIIDIGGESTRPFSEELSPDEELKRVIPVIKNIRNFDDSIPLSIDTRHSRVAKEAVKCGVDIINDISGMEWDKKMAAIAAQTGIPIVIMHSLSSPETMQIDPVYNENVVDFIYKDLFRKTQKALEVGIKQENIIIDPGIGFGKTLEHNIELIKRIEEFKSLGYPVLIGISRKSVISQVLNLPAEEREEANIALNSYAASKGVNIIRVHEIY